MEDLLMCWDEGKLLILVQRVYRHDRRRKSTKWLLLKVVQSDIGVRHGKVTRDRESHSLNRCVGVYIYYFKNVCVFDLKYDEGLRRPQQPVLRKVLTKRVIKRER